VPQGSVLGPLIFLIYINEALKENENIKYVAYADDIVLLTNDSQPTEVIEEMQTELDSFLKWAHDNDLIVNPKKNKT
jgi:hypothetical protein